MNLASITFNAAGVTFQNRQAYLINASRMGISKLTLFRDRNNKFDANAIKILGVINGKKLQLGFVPRETAAELASVMDRGTYVHITDWSVHGGSGLSYGLKISAQYLDRSLPVQCAAAVRA